MADGVRVKSVAESPVAYQIRHRAEFKHQGDLVFPVYFVEWYDDCDPNNSIKGNRGGVYLKTVTALTFGTQCSTRMLSRVALSMLTMNK